MAKDRIRLDVDALPRSLRPVFGSEEAISEVVEASEQILDFYLKLVSSKRFGPYAACVFLEKDLLVVTAASAYVDMSRLEPFHDLQGGPSGVRRHLIT